ncbi:MAG: hypothetical protein ABW277_04095 [Longimicrobiaceae bacterium]
MRRATRPPAAAAVLAAALGLAGCGEAGGRGEGVAVRDSAGVRVVASAAPAWGDGEGWRLSPEPVLRVGVAEGDAAYQFGSVAGAVRLADGGIAVADRQSGDVRWYDARGRHVRTVGRKGGGPGEFTRIGWIQAVGDSLAVGDGGASRVTILGPDGAVLRTTAMVDDTSGRRPRPVAALPGGAVLASLGAPFDPARAATGARDSVTYLRQAPDGAPPTVLGRFPGTEQVVRVAENSVSIMDVPFGRRDHVAVRGDGFYAGSADRTEVGRYDARGRLVGLVRWGSTPRPVTPADVAVYRERALAGADPAARPGMQRMLADLPYPKAMPAYARILVDRAGALWVQEYSPSEEDPVRWTVFDADERQLGTLTLPPRFRLTDAGPDYAVGVGRDDMDVEQVQVYRLDRSRG